LTELIVYIREFNIASVLLRLILASFFGGLVGLERGKRHKAAGFRTYMLVCIGATLTMILGQYPYNSYGISSAMVNIGVKPDVTRLSAQVINGIGFLGAGSIIVTGHQAVKGLTTASALWASACMGLVIGAGYYECVLLGFLLIIFCITLLNPIESYLIGQSRNMNLYVELKSLDDVRTAASYLRSKDIHIYDIDIEKGKSEEYRYPSAVFSLRLEKRQSHTEVITAMFEQQYIKYIEEI